MKKKIMIGILLGTIIFNIYGCNYKKTENKKINLQEVTTETKTPKYEQKYNIGEKVMLADKNDKNSEYIYTIFEWDDWTNTSRVEEKSEYTEPKWYKENELIKSPYNNQLEYCEDKVGRNNILTDNELYRKYLNRELGKYFYIEGKVVSQNTDSGIGSDSVFVVENNNNSCEIIWADSSEITEIFKEKMENKETIKFYGFLLLESVSVKYEILLPGILTNKNLIINE